MNAWILLTGVPLGLLFAFVMSPWGAPALALLASSRFARWLAIAAAVAWASFVAAGRIRKFGRDEARAEMLRSNERARVQRDRIERDVAARPDDEVTRQLQRWSR